MSRPIRWIMVGSMTLCALCLLVYSLRHKAVMDAKQAEEAKDTALAVQESIWDAADYRHLQRIEDKSATLSNEDFGWLMSEMTSTIQPSRGDRETQVDLVEGELHDARLTPSQSAEAAKAAVYLLYHDDHDYKGLIRQDACKLLEKYHDKAAIPKLLVLLNSPDVWARYHSAIALNTMGYKVTVPPRPTKW